MTAPATAAPTATPVSVAVLGTGMMGFPMAQRLCAAGHRVHVWNRTRAKAEPLAAAGASVHSQAADAVRPADITISLLENGPVVSEVLFGKGVAPALRVGSLYIEMASIQPSEARDHAARLGEMGVSHLDAPVSGGTVGAEAGTLAIMAGGKPADFQRALAVFAALGRATHVGPHGVIFTKAFKAAHARNTLAQFVFAAFQNLLSPLLVGKPCASEPYKVLHAVIKELFGNCRLTDCRVAYYRNANMILYSLDELAAPALWEGTWFNTYRTGFIDSAADVYYADAQLFKRH